MLLKQGEGQLVETELLLPLIQGAQYMRQEEKTALGHWDLVLLPFYKCSRFYVYFALTTAQKRARLEIDKITSGAHFCPCTIALQQTYMVIH